MKRLTKQLLIIEIQLNDEYFASVEKARELSAAVERAEEALEPIASVKESYIMVDNRKVYLGAGVIR